jgi:hypothetical protein
VHQESQRLTGCPQEVVVKEIGAVQIHAFSSGRQQQLGVKKAKKVSSLSPPSVAPHRIGWDAIAYSANRGSAGFHKEGQRD